MPISTRPTRTQGSRSLTADGSILGHVGHVDGSANFFGSSGKLALGVEKRRTCRSRKEVAIKLLLVRETSMSNFVLYHGLGIRGYQHLGAELTRGQLLSTSSTNHQLAGSTNAPGPDSSKDRITYPSTLQKARPLTAISTEPCPPSPGWLPSRRSAYRGPCASVDSRSR